MTFRKNEYKYFVSYSHVNDSGFGFGSGEIITNFKIKSFNDIREIRNHIIDIIKKEYPNPDPVILFWREF